MSDPYAVEFRHLEKRFGARTVLKDISFQINRGEIVFILGTSGTGKSVLLKTLVGLFRADGGDVLIAGESVVGLTEEQYLPIRRRCGMVFQHPALFDSMSVAENVAYGLMKHNGWTLKQSEVRVRECLSLVGLKDIENKYPAQISYGMQKRVSLARTIAIGPEILLSDEPTTGLDPVTTKQVNHLIKELAHKLKTTALVVSHDMVCALEIADQIVVLDQGLVVERGTPKQILGSKNPLVVDFLAEVREGVE